MFFSATAGGGDGKGLQSKLEETLLGPDNCATLEPNVFIEPGEFRKSGHFAFNKLRVGISECKSKSNYEFDIWKRWRVYELCTGVNTIRCAKLVLASTARCSMSAVARAFVRHRL